MFAEFNEDNFPIVYVKINSRIENDNDFQLFLNHWKLLYKNKKNFTFIFDTKDVNWIPIKYSIKMALFIKELKKEEHQYLQKSIINIYSENVNLLLNFIFIIQKPVAPVEIYKNNKIIKIYLP